MSDAEIVALLVAGDVRGLEAAYTAYADRIHDYARSFLRLSDASAAADVTHDTFLIALAKAGDLREPSRLRSWLYAIARNECLRTLRHKRRIDPLEYDATPHPGLVAAETEGSPDMSTGLSRTDLQGLVRAAADGLSPKDREIFELGMRHELDAGEIAKALGVSSNTAHARLSRVRVQFEKALGALVVARQRRSACNKLETVLADWNGEFDPLWRKRIARHIESCENCQNVQRHELSPAALLGLVPLVAAPLAVKSRIFEDSFDLVAHSQALAERAGSFDDDGFPVFRGDGDGSAVFRKSEKKPRRGPLAIAVVLLLVIGGIGGILFLLQGRVDTGVVISAGPPPLDRPSTTPTPSSLIQSPSPITLTPMPPPPGPTGSTSTFAPSPSVGVLRVLPGSLTIKPGGTGTVRVAAARGAVEWTTVREDAAAQLASLSAASGQLDPGEMTTVTVTVSPQTPRSVTELVVVFSPGDHRLVITVDHNRIVPEPTPLPTPTHTPPG